MVSLSRKKKHSLRKKNYKTKRRSYKKSSLKLENLKKEIEDNILEKLKQTNTENENKPKSGHVEAGKTWDQSEAGKQWKNEIDSAQKELDTLLQQMGYNITASGKYPIILAGKKRKNPEQSQQFAEEIANKIIEEAQTKKIKKSAKIEKPQNFTDITIEKPKSPTKLYPKNNTELQNQTYQTPIVGGFFDYDSDEE